MVWEYYFSLAVKDRLPRYFDAVKDRLLRYFEKTGEYMSQITPKKISHH
jgi:hypothetical protein